MDEWDNDDDEEIETTRPRAEGVRILGAEEAAAAVNAQASGAEPPMQEPLRFERRAAPEPPAADDLWSAADDDAPQTRTMPVTAAPPNLPHWTEPPTGEVPAVLSGRFGETDDDSFDEGESEDDLAAWSALSGGAPRWRDQHDAWDDSGYDDASVLADPEPPLGALDESRGSFDFEEDASEFAVPYDNTFDADEAAPIPLRPSTPSFPTPSLPTSPGPARATRTRPPRPSRPQVGAGTRRPAAAAPRNIQSAVVLGGGLAVIALILFKLGPEPTMLLATAVVVLAAAELYDVLRRAGYQPATLVGLAGTVGLMIAAYAKGESALPLAIFLVLTASFAWYLIKVVNARPTVNVAATVLAFLWTGVLGSYSALILGLDKQGHGGVAILLGAVLATVASDVGAFFVGSRMGTRPLAPEISPNKTVEGLIGGAVAAVVVSVLVLKYIPGVSPWDGGKAIRLGLVVAVVAPLGDLFESMVKRDLGIKDMGNLLPGHGGVLDRFDALLFVLPATYYLVHLF